MPLKLVRCESGVSAIPKEFLVNNNQTILRGYIVALSNGKLSAAADAAAAGTIAGVAMEAITTTTATASDKILVDINPQSVYNATWSGTGPAAVGTAYDIGANAGVIDADDSTGGYVMCVGNVDTTAKTADFMIGNRYNQVG